MNKSALTTGLLITGGLIIAAGAGTYFYQQYKLTDKVCYAADGFKILKAGFKHTSIEVNVLLKNKGELAIDVKKMSLDVYANNQFVANVNQDVTAVITPFGTTNVPVRITFNPEDVLSKAGLILGASSMNNIRWDFDGKIVVRKFGIPIPIPLKLSYTTEELRSPSKGSIC